MAFCLKKILEILTLSILIFGCQNRGIDALTQTQIEFLQSKINSNHEKLVEKVEETGYSPAGKRFIALCQSITDQTDRLIFTVQQGEKLTKSDIGSFINLTRNKWDTIPVDSLFIYNSFEEFQISSNEDSFIISLLLFNSDVVNNTRMVFEGYFNDIEYLEPIVIADDFTIKKGEIFRGKAICQAKMAAVKFKYELDDPQSNDGYRELSSYLSSGYDGIVKIPGTVPGKHIIKLRSTHWHNGTQRVYENEFYLTVTE